MTGRRWFNAAGALLPGSVIAVLLASSGWFDSRSRAGAEGAEVLPADVVPAGDLALPTRIVAAGDELVVLDRYASYAIKAIGIDDGATRRRFGPPGQGPRELSGPFALSIHDDRLIVVDAGLNRVTELRASGSEFEVLSLTTLLAAGTVVDAVHSRDGKMLGVALGEGKGLIEVDSSGSVSYLYTAIEPHPLLDPAEAAQGVLRRSLDGQRYVRTRRYSPRLEILDPAGGFLLTVGGTAAERVPERADLHFGYLDVAPTMHGFLALYSGRQRGHDANPNFGATIDRFDWEGVWLTRHHIDSDLIAIAWNPRDGRLYGIRHEPEPQIVTYRIPH